MVSWQSHERTAAQAVWQKLCIIGAEWEIVRIPTNMLRSNPEKLVDAVRAARKEKVRIRKENGGIIPAYYSRQSKAVMQELEKLF